MVCRCACGGVRAGHIGSDHTRTRSRPSATPLFGSQMGSKPVRLIKSSGLARMAQRTTNARRGGLFLRPENEHVILGRGTSDRANTRAVDGQFAAAERHSTASSGRLRPATHRPAWRRPYARGMAPSGWRPEDHSHNDSRVGRRMAGPPQALNRPNAAVPTNCSGFRPGPAGVNLHRHTSPTLQRDPPLPADRVRHPGEGGGPGRDARTRGSSGK
jgi:hypothetical protein